MANMAGRVDSICGLTQLHTSPKPFDLDDANIEDTMHVAYAILCHIKELKLPCLKGKQMECVRADLFKAGPSWRRASWESQTKIGLVLDISYGSPALDTPLGQWCTGIISHSAGPVEVTEMIDSLQKTLGLKLLQDVTVTSGGDFGPCYSVTQWKDKTLPDPTYRNTSELIPLKKVKATWSGLSQEFFPKKNK